MYVCIVCVCVLCPYFCFCFLFLFLHEQKGDSVEVIRQKDEENIEREEREGREGIEKDESQLQNKDETNINSLSKIRGYETLIDTQHTPQSKQFKMKSANLNNDKNRYQSLLDNHTPPTINTDVEIFHTLESNDNRNNSNDQRQLDLAKKKRKHLKKSGVYGSQEFDPNLPKIDDIYNDGYKLYFCFLFFFIFFVFVFVFVLFYEKTNHSHSKKKKTE